MILNEKYIGIVTVDGVNSPNVVPPIVEKPTALIAFEKDLKTVKKSIDKILTALELFLTITQGNSMKTTKKKTSSLTRL